MDQYNSRRAGAEDWRQSGTVQKAWSSHGLGSIVAVGAVKTLSFLLLRRLETCWEAKANEIHRHSHSHATFCVHAMVSASPSSPKDRVSLSILKAFFCSRDDRLL